MGFQWFWQSWTITIECYNVSQYALRGIVVSYVLLLFFCFEQASIWCWTKETRFCVWDFPLTLVLAYLNMFSPDHYQGRTRLGGRAEEILNNPLLTLSFSLRKPQFRFDPQKPATHLTKTDVAMVVITVKELKEPFTVLRPEEFLENNRSPGRSTLILLEKLSRPHRHFLKCFVQDGARIHRP